MHRACSLPGTLAGTKLPPCWLTPKAVFTPRWASSESPSHRPGPIARDTARGESSQASKQARGGGALIPAGAWSHR
eukprot:scaffold14553_cov120-Isochrysis_galbana.AAC.7